MQTLARILPRSRPIHTGAAGWTALFWLSTYAVFSVRGRLFVDAKLDWIDERRLLAVSIGAIFYALAIAFQDRIARKPLALRGGAALGAAAVSAASLLPVRLLFEGGWGDPASRSAELRWLITWLGYFLAWTAFYVAAVNARAIQAGEDNGEGAGADEIWAQRGQQRIRIPVSSLEYVEAEGNYACLHADGGQGLIRVPLATLEKQLGVEFARVHRSVICRRSAIEAVERVPTGAFRARLASGAVIPVGRRMGAALLEATRSSVASSGLKRARIASRAAA